jgi:hypothetical protein
MVIPPYFVTANLRTFEGHGNGHFSLTSNFERARRHGDISARADKQSDIRRHKPPEAQE